MLFFVVIIKMVINIFCEGWLFCVLIFLIFLKVLIFYKNNFGYNVVFLFLMYIVLGMFVCIVVFVVE